MTKLRHAQTQPPLYYVHSESDLAREGIDGSYGLAAGYLSARALEPLERDLWEKVFHKRWKDACFSLAEGLKETGVDAFAIVPCSRADVVEEMGRALRAGGVRELPGFITKANSTVSLAGKDGAYIGQNVFLRMGHEYLRDVKTLAVCDDFAETGKTLFGLHEALSRERALAHKQIVLAAVGVSAQLSDTSLSERHKLAAKRVTKI